MPARRVFNYVNHHPWTQNILLVILILSTLAALYGAVGTAVQRDRICQAVNGQSQKTLALIERSTEQGRPLRNAEEQRRAEVFLEKARMIYSPIECGGPLP